MVLLILEKKLGIDITKKIWSYYRDLLLEEYMLKVFKYKNELKLDKYFVSDGCVWITFNAHIILTTSDYMNIFYRQFIGINRKTIIHLLYRPEIHDD